MWALYTVIDSKQILHLAAFTLHYSVVGYSKENSTV